MGRLRLTNMDRSCLEILCFAACTALTESFSALSAIRLQARLIRMPANSLRLKGSGDHTRIIGKLTPGGLRSLECMQASDRSSAPSPAPAWTRTEKCNIILVGNPRVGKTSMGSELARRYVTFVLYHLRSVSAYALSQIV